MEQINSGPIPGANMTSDPKNYPWRQPPKFSDIDKALDFLVKKVTDFKVANGFLTMSEIGLPLYKQAEMILMQGMSGGFWTFDYALLLAGPLTRIIELIHIGYEVEYDIGTDEDKTDFQTGQFFKDHHDFKQPKAGFKIVAQDLAEVKDAAANQDMSHVDNSASPDPNAAPPEAAPAGGGDLQTQGFMAMSAAPAEKGGK
jgi:hypothetical protein